MTDEQRKLAEDNEWVIWFVMKQYDLGEKANEDWYGILAETYLRAVQTFSEEKNVKFSAYANFCMRREIARQHQLYNHDVRKIHCPELKMLTSIDAPVKDTDGDVSLADIIPAKGMSFEERVEHEDTVLGIFSRIWCKLNETQKRYIEILYGNILEYTDLNQKEIGKLLGMSQQSLWHLRKGVQKIIEEEMECNNGRELCSQMQ